MSAESLGADARLLATFTKEYLSLSLLHSMRVVEDLRVAAHHCIRTRETGDLQATVLTKRSRIAIRDEPCDLRFAPPPADGNCLTSR